jgi:hypothetical protein
MNLIPEDRRQTMWSIERGVLELLEISTDVTSNIFSRFGCTVALDVGTGTVTIDGGKATKAGIWFENTVASVKVDRTPKSPIFVAAMRLRDVAREAASTLKQFPASFEVTDNELVVYTWRDADVMKVISAIDGVVQESQVEVYQFAANSRSKQFFYSRLVYWTTHCAHSVCIQVDHNDHRIYHMAGLVEHVKVLYDELLPYQCHKIVRRVTPSQAQLLQAYGDSLFDSADDCHMTLSADNNEMEVYCTQRVVVEVKQKCDSIFNQIASDSCAVTRDHDIDMTGITHLLNGIEIDNRVVIQYDQSDNRDDRESRYEAMLMCPSYCVDISDKTQLRLVDADITDLCVDAIVSTIDEHGTPNTALAEHIVAKGWT